ncbi:L,D-transpeptidase family protein [Blautia sp. CLA-JM-H16]|uniref:L,D-transpeptidase family protein n=1 Tax=Blautia aquisgranensis TaxID=3133153 RepID=A0ABV1B9W0_9FIRM
MEKKSISRKTLVLGICIVAAVVAVAGLFGYTYMADHNTLGRKISVSGLDVSRLTAEQAEEKIISSFENRTVVFQENDQQVYSTTLKNLGYSLNKDALLEKLNKLQKQREENRKLFPKEENVDLEYQIKQDEEQEKQALNLSNFGDKERKASIDASISYDKEKKEFILTKQKQGNEIDEDKLLTTVDTTLDAAFDTAFLGDVITVPVNKHVYVSPLVTATEDMQNKVDSLNAQLAKYRKTTVTYTFGSETVVLDSDTIDSWLKAEGETLSVDEEAVKTYISDLANKYNTIYVPRAFHTSTGTDITIEGNEYGYRIDQDGELAQLLEDLKSGTAVTRDPIYSKTGYQRNGTDDLAGSYIEVSLDAQHLWLYKDGNLVTETDIVSGKPVKGRETYRGAWPIAYKASPYNLTSAEYGYNVKVNYWMPFVYGQGLHDATWQSSFGGNRYKTNGSHGCINLPKDQAATIYNTIDAGYPIIIY